METPAGNHDPVSGRNSVNRWIVLLPLLIRFLLLFFQQRKQNGRLAALMAGSLFLAILLAGLHLFELWMIPLFSAAILVWMLQNPDGIPVQRLLVSVFLEDLFVCLLLLEDRQPSVFLISLFLCAISLVSCWTARRLLTSAALQKSLIPVSTKNSSLFWIALAQVLQACILWKPQLAFALLASLLFFQIWLTAQSLHQEQEVLRQDQEHLQQALKAANRQSQTLFAKQQAIHERLHSIKNEMLLLREHLKNTEERSMTETILHQIQDSFEPLYSSDSFLHFVLKDRIQSLPVQNRPRILAECPEDFDWTADSMLPLLQSADWIFARPGLQSAEWKITREWMGVHAQCERNTNHAASPEQKEQLHALQQLAEDSGGFCTWKDGRLNLMVFFEIEEAP